MRPFTPLLALLGLVLATLLTGCAAKRSMETAEAYGGYAEYDDYGGYSQGAMPSADYEEAVAAPGRARPQSRSAAPAPPREPGPAAQQTPAEPAEPAQPAKRMVFYNGYARMKATKPEDLIAEVVALAESEGGYVERRSQQDVTVRVPVERFLDFYEAALALDEVLEKSLSAQDITEAYAAVDLRLRTARATRERLQELLAQAETEEEKLELLRQIRRLTEEIDVAEAELRTLASLAATSRMTVVAVPRDAFSSGSAQLTVDGMGWIHRINPFTNAVTGEGKRLELDTPEGFVQLDLKRRFEAEAADGTTLHAARILNEPQGDEAFWIEAVKAALGPEFASADVSVVGGYATLRLEQPGAEAPYAWVVAVRVSGRYLELVEIYYPSPEHEARHEAAIEAILSAGGNS
ncbi:MAG: DUF4349 domain-containing protein [Alphaproteobacteria bacterium]|nr:DUF4349 domain-containing protein [Alphaproteobacteria bacterium]MCB9795690.1 DUF4349 domain-containing protein [Alphaproteobacteria bacterium]